MLRVLDQDFPKIKEQRRTSIARIFKSVCNKLNGKAKTKGV